MNVEDTEFATGFSLGILGCFDLFDFRFNTELFLLRDILLIEEVELLPNSSFRVVPSKLR